MRASARKRSWATRTIASRTTTTRDAEPGAATPDASRGTALKIDMERALALLSEGERAAIVACYYNDLSHEEAAFVLGCPVGTVKTHVLRGKQKLKRALEAWALRRRADLLG